MKKGFVRVQLVPGNEQWINEQAGKQLKETAIYPMMVLIAQMLDARAEGEDCFITIGASRNNSSLLLSLTYDGEKQSVSGETLEKLGVGCKVLL